MPAHETEQRVLSPSRFTLDLPQASKPLKARRQELGLSHEEAAERAGLHRSTISRVESKKINGTLFVFQSIANALEVSLSDLCREAEKKVGRK